MKVHITHLIQTGFSILTLDLTLDSSLFTSNYPTSTLR